VNLTGSPSYPARIRVIGDPGGGCSGNQYAQFNTAAFAGPAYNSLGLESRSDLLGECFQNITDLSIARNIRLGGGKQVQLRVDMFNAFNTVVINGRQNQIQFNSPTDLTLRNPQYVVNAGDTTLAPGATGTVLAAGRDLPRNAGFGAANAWSTNQINTNYARFIQFTIRVQF
jgi:hypothetical protein